MLSDFLFLGTQIVRVLANLSYLWFWNSLVLQILESKIRLWLAPKPGRRDLERVESGGREAYYDREKSIL